MGHRHLHAGRRPWRWAAVCLTVLAGTVGSGCVQSPVANGAVAAPPAMVPTTASPAATGTLATTASAPLAATTGRPVAPKQPAASDAAPLGEAERQTGLQIAHIGLTAQGGLVDVRFRVLDPAKAQALLRQQGLVPMLMAADKAPLVPPANTFKGMRVSAGQVFFVLYPNARGAVRPGEDVVVAIGDHRFDPVKAQ